MRCVNCGWEVLSVGAVPQVIFWFESEVKVHIPSCLAPWRVPGVSYSKEEI